MRHRTGIVLALFVLALPLFTFGQKGTRGDENSLIIVFRDGRQKAYAMADIARIEFNTPQASAAKGQNRFLGKWKVGDGAGSTFYITLEPDGVASKSMGAIHGHWTIVSNEARISWDDGWHDAIRKNGAKYEKVAYAPGKSFTEDPDNVTKAEHAEAEPL